MASQEIDPEVVNHLILAWRDGEPTAYNQLISLLHEDLRQIARRLFNRERPGHTLQTDDLVSKLYLKLLGAKTVPWESYAHFLNAAARAMRQILIDHARGRALRGDGAGKVTLEPWQMDLECAVTGVRGLHHLISMNEAIEKLQALDADMARVADWKLSLGLTLDEIARRLATPLTNIKREWLVAKKILGTTLWGRHEA